ncbi:MAG: hypothetical protein Q9213_000845 [Squamulea squamosa]
MPSSSAGRTFSARLPGASVLVGKRTRPSQYTCVFCQRTTVAKRSPSSFRSYSGSSRPDNGPFRSRLRTALGKTKIEWRPIPITLGVGFLGAIQFYRVRKREQAKEDEEQEERIQQSHKPAKRKKIRPSGPWQVQVMSTLPLKAVSRLWGRFNELEIPFYLRVPGFRLYSWIFGVNLAEASESDLHIYPNLASFFYRTLKPGVRPLDPNPSALLSPADGRVLQIGMIEHGEVEQVKGMTYSLDALLGKEPPTVNPAQEQPNKPASDHVASSVKIDDEDIVKADEEFARVNGISYTLPNLFSGPGSPEGASTMDASTTPKSSSEAEVRAEFALGDGSQQSWWSPTAKKVPTGLFYAVVYLAPGDYHRFHSPTSWVVEKRRHFAGELYSVSPYLQRTLPGLFTLNERVVLLGRWRWGFFSFTPVGATNVGSIKINFDRELRTNSLTTDTAADQAAEEAADCGEPYSGFAEATYGEASKLLGGHALRRGEEMGGFQLGSSIVLVFEAPKGVRKSLDDGWREGERKGGWRWGVRQGQRVKYGEAIGWVDEENI